MASQLTDGRDGHVEVAATEREERLAELVVALADENANLQRSLDTRVVIEQAKGVLAERFDVDVYEAFRLLRTSARSNRMRLHDLAARVVDSRQTPPEIEEIRLGRGHASRA
jgi:AmiR/NasT family two-component response regulator